MLRIVSTKVARLAAAFLVATFTLSCGSSSEPPTPVAKVSLTPADDTVRVGETAQLTATSKDGNGNTLSGRTVTWTSGSPGVASISQTGLVTGVSDGTSTITAT